MPGTTTTLAFPYLLPGDPPDIAGSEQSLAQAIETYLLGGSWIAVPFGASYSAESGTGNPQMKIKLGEVQMHGSIIRTAGNFPTSTTNTIISVGGLPTAYRPSVPYSFMCSMRSVDTAARCNVNPDGSMTLVTGAATTDRFDLGPVRYSLT